MYTWGAIRKFLYCIPSLYIKFQSLPLLWTMCVHNILYQTWETDTRTSEILDSCWMYTNFTVTNDSDIWKTPADNKCRVQPGLKTNRSVMQEEIIIINGMEWICNTYPWVSSDHKQQQLDFHRSTATCHWLKPVIEDHYR